MRGYSDLVLKRLATSGTCVQFACLHNVALAQPNPLPDLRPDVRVGIRTRQDRVEKGALRKRVPRIVHDRIEIVFFAQRVDFVARHLLEVIVLVVFRRVVEKKKCQIYSESIIAPMPMGNRPASLYMLIDDFNITVAVRAGMFVPKSDHVAEFVHDDAKLVAILPDRNRLGPITTTTDERTAATVTLINQYSHCVVTYHFPNHP